MGDSRGLRYLPSLSRLKAGPFQIATTSFAATSGAEFERHRRKVVERRMSYTSTVKEITFEKTFGGRFHCTATVRLTHGDAWYLDNRTEMSMKWSPMPPPLGEVEKEVNHWSNECMRAFLDEIPAKHYRIIKPRVLERFV